MIKFLFELTPFTLIHIVVKVLCSTFNAVALVVRPLGFAPAFVSRHLILSLEDLSDGVTAEAFESWIVMAGVCTHIERRIGGLNCWTSDTTELSRSFSVGLGQVTEHIESKLIVECAALTLSGYTVHAKSIFGK